MYGLTHQKFSFDVALMSYYNPDVNGNRLIAIIWPKLTENSSDLIGGRKHVTGIVKTQGIAFTY